MSEVIDQLSILQERNKAYWDRVEQAALAYLIARNTYTECGNQIVPLTQEEVARSYEVKQRSLRYYLWKTGKKL